MCAVGYGGAHLIGQGMVASTAPTIPADAVGALDAATVDARASVIVNRAFLLLGEGEPEIRWGYGRATIGPTVEP